MLSITKTPKCYVGGAFIRSESGRVYESLDKKKQFIANIPRCTRKDLRNAVEAAAKSGPGWNGRTPYNRAQILYRLAEMMESRAEDLSAAIAAYSSPAAAEKELRTSIERIVHFAGWADKYEQVLGSVNPVAAPFFNFTVTEPVGIVGVIAPEEAPLLALLTLILPAIISGNAVVALASHSQPYLSILLGEILAVSDLPGGVINLLTGFHEEILPTFATHEHIRAISSCVGKEEAILLQQGSAQSVKRFTNYPTNTDWFSNEHNTPYSIRNYTESKTIWHPIGS